MISCWQRITSGWVSSWRTPNNTISLMIAAKIQVISILIKHKWLEILTLNMIRKWKFVFWKNILKDMVSCKSFTTTYFSKAMMCLKLCLIYLVMHTDRLVQERRNSIANAVELHLSCANLSIWYGVIRCVFLEFPNTWISYNKRQYSFPRS